MKTGIISVGVLLWLAGTGTVSADSALDAVNMGLSKTSVFDTPTPQPYSYSSADPKEAEALPRAYTGIPPQIPHRVDEYLPITAEDNQCLDCHEWPDLIGKEKPGKSPMSKSHYLDSRNPGKAMSDEVVGARYNCTQCHVPQSGAPALVENTFRGGK